MSENPPMRLHVESHHSLPLVHLQLVIGAGAAHDPPGLPGVARAAARLLRRGTQLRSREQFDDAVEALGAELSVEVAHGHVRLSATVIRRNLAAMVELLEELLQRPALAAEELRSLLQETDAQLVELLDNDAALAGINLRRLVFAGHPYARPVSGTRQSLPRIGLEHVQRFLDEHLRRAPMWVGFAGDIRPAEAEAIAARLVGDGRHESARTPPPPIPQQATGRRLRVVDKPARTQTQIQVGRLGTHPGDPDHHALIVGNAVFGGSFTARLMKEIRSDRGWSYGASSRLSIDRVRDMWNMWTFPAASDAAPCLQLSLSLMADWIEAGIEQAERDFAVGYLRKGYAFSIDTPDKRLEQQVDIWLHDLPPDYFSSYCERLAQVRVAQVNAALQQRLSAANVWVAVTATDADTGHALRSLGFDHEEVVPFDAPAPLEM